MLTILCAASFLAVVDTTIVSIALPSIRAAMTLSLDDSHWVLNSYVLVFGGLLLLCGRLGDRVGRRRLFLGGLLLFAVGSAVAGSASRPEMLSTGRVVQGLAAAAFVPTSLSLLTAIFTSPKARSSALAAYGAMAGLGFAAGMVGGGVITQYLGWRWIFWINLPIVALILIPARYVLPTDPIHRPRSRLDLLGAVTVTVGLFTAIYAFTSAPGHGWASAQTLGAGLIATLAIATFVATERRHADPLIPLPVIGQRAIATANGAVALQSMAGVAWLYLLTSYFQNVHGLDALACGLAFAPMTAASVAGAGIAGRAVPRLGIRRTAVVGLLVMTGGLCGMTAAGAAPQSLAAMIASMIVAEAGFMLGSVALTIAATGVLDDHESGLAAGLLNTATQLGGGLGLGIVAAVVSTTATSTLAPALQAGFATCIIFGVGALALASLIDQAALPTHHHT